MGIPQRKIYDPILGLECRTSAKPTELFLSGPIPFDWIRKACLEPADRLALILRAFLDMRGVNELRVSAEICRYAGISDRYQRRRCLQKLASTGLFEISAAQGRSPVAKRLWR